MSKTVLDSNNEPFIFLKFSRVVSRWRRGGEDVADGDLAAGENSRKMKNVRSSCRVKIITVKSKCNKTGSWI